MHGLAQFMQQIISRINNIVYGPLPDCFQPFFQPFRGGTNVYVFNNSGHVTWTQIPVPDLNPNYLICFLPGFFYPRFTTLYSRLRQRGYFSGNAQDTPAIRAVG